ncbi:general substrate transporter [Lelliottia amnigena]|nr:general substrate transporter [Lelliottia amnigena]
MNNSAQQSLETATSDREIPVVRKLRKVLLATGIGHFVEWFDFGLYGTLRRLSVCSSSRPKVRQLRYCLPLPFLVPVSLCVRWADSISDRWAIALGVKKCWRR